MKSWETCAHRRDPPPDPYLYPLPPLLNGERRERIKTLSNVFSRGFLSNYSIVRIKIFNVRQYKMSGKLKHFPSIFMSIHVLLIVWTFQAV